jgi:hypothetical protein
MDGQGSELTRELNSRQGLTPVFDDLNRYQATMHFNGQSAITPDGNQPAVRATASPTISSPTTVSAS